MPDIMVEKNKQGLKSALAAEGVKSIKRKPVWLGPMDSGPIGGVTQSLLKKFLVCRDRFRVRVIEGLDSLDSFSHRLEYGNMWHVCEEHSHKGTDWLKPLQEFSIKLKLRHRTAHEQIDHWYEVCKRQFPAYLAYGKTQKPVGKRKSVMQEKVFHVPYELPWSGRVVYLRGKWDGAHILSGCTKPKPGLWIDEHKTKGDIDEPLLQRQLKFDLQTMFYLIALKEYRSPDEAGISFEEHVGQRIVGVRYNVIRRPLSGGKGSIVQHKPSKKNPRGEQRHEFYDRLDKDYFRTEPEYYFMRWTVEVSANDIAVFKKICMDPLLEQLCDWWQTQNGQKADTVCSSYQHYRFPYGVDSPLTDGYSTGFDEYLTTGSMLGLRRNVALFEELLDA